MSSTSPRFILAEHVHAQNVASAQYVSLFQEQFIAENLTQNIGYEFKNTEYLFAAFLHRSMAHERSELAVLMTQQRLEFLGDGILNAIVSHFLILRFTTLNEGELSKMRSRLVSTSALALLCEDLNLTSLMLVGKGELKNYPPSEKMQADLVEALLGAIYLDSNFQTAMSVLRFWLESFEKRSMQPLWDLEFAQNLDEKSQLQEWTLARFKELPLYEDEQVGSEFKVKVLVKGKVWGESMSLSKKKAQKAAAKISLDKLSEHYKE
jgi:ribonuclease-3